MKRLTKSFFIAILICSGFITCFAQSNSFQGVSFSFSFSDGKTEDGKTSFRTGEEIFIKTFIENYSVEPFSFLISDDYYLYKFSLAKEGENLLVSYRKDKAALLLLREENSMGTGRQLIPDPIYPGNFQQLETLKLGDRYENLTPGKYTLSIEYKTLKFIQINEIKKRLRLTYEATFEILP